MTAAALRAWLAAEGHAPYRADQVLRWIYGRGALSFADMSNLPRALRERLGEVFTVPTLPVERVARAGDGTRKLVFRLDTDRAIESVIIPDPPRLTVCVSSQAGCAMGCAFCATARLGLLRNLTAGEIAAQVVAARALLGPNERITNVVFMGMGEPLHNYQEVVDAIGILTAPWGMHISPRRITVSTVGLVPAMRRLITETAVNLAVSLAATTDDLRERIVPLNRKYPLAVLLDACRQLPLPQRRRITFEYVMLKGVNDGVVDAERLIRLMHGIRCKINLIPFNPFPGCGYERSDDATVAAFRDRLDAARVHATIRASRGSEVAAACGQLAGSASGL